MSRRIGLVLCAFASASLARPGRLPQALAASVAERANPAERRAVRGRSLEQPRHPDALAALLAAEPQLLADAGEQGRGLSAARIPRAPTARAEDVRDARAEVAGTARDEDVSKAGLGRRSDEPIAAARSRRAFDRPTFTTGYLPGDWAGTGEVSGGEPVPPTSDSAAEPRADGRLQLPDLDVRFGGRLSLYLDRLSSRNETRAALAGLLARLGHYRPLVENELAAAGLPTDVAFVALAASGFDPAARGSDGRAGLWMLDEAAARAAGLEVGFWVDQRRDPDLATRAAAARLGALYGQYGVWPLALVAFHAGQAVLDAAIARRGTRDYESLVEALPSASVRFVARVQALAVIAHNQTALGFAGASIEPPILFEYAAARPGVTLASMAKALGLGAGVLEALNPALIRQRVPPSGSPVRVRLPPGTGGRLVASLDAVLTREDRVKAHPLVLGESLEDVASGYGLSTGELRRLNRITDAIEIRGADVLAVPADVQARPFATASPRSEGGAELSGDKLLAALPELPGGPGPGRRLLYRVVEGDTLAALAAALRVPEAVIVASNNLDPGARLQAGMILQVFLEPGAEPPRLRLLDPGRVEVVTLGSEAFHALDVARKGRRRLRYQARAGETLESVGRRFGMAAADLARINRISARRVLEAGDEVVVYASPARAEREASARRQTRRQRPDSAADSGRGSAGSPASKRSEARRPR